MAIFSPSGELFHANRASRDYFDVSYSLHLDCRSRLKAAAHRGVCVCISQNSEVPEFPVEFSTVTDLGEASFYVTLCGTFHSPPSPVFVLVDVEAILGLLFSGLVDSALLRHLFAYDNARVSLVFECTGARSKPVKFIEEECCFSVSLNNSVFVVILRFSFHHSAFVWCVSSLPICWPSSRNTVCSRASCSAAPSCFLPSSPYPIIIFFSWSLDVYEDQLRVPFYQSAQLPDPATGWAAIKVWCFSIEHMNPV